MKLQRIKVAKNWYADEFISKELYTKFISINRKDLILNILDAQMIALCQLERDLFGPTTCNNWYHGGIRNSSGIRMPGDSYFNPNSLHSYRLNATDTITPNVSAEEKREHIRNNWELWKSYGLTRIEGEVAIRDEHGNIIRYIKPTWLHKDKAFTGLTTLKEVKG